MDLLTLETHDAVPLALRRELGYAVRFGTVAVAGYAWGGPDALLALVPFVVACFWHARSRCEAGLVVATYHVVAARSLIVGGARFFDVSLVCAASLVVASAALIGAVWALCWMNPGRARGTGSSAGWTAVRTGVVIGVTVLPPVGAFAVPHPLSAAGIWFPGWGFAGLALMVVAFGAMRSVRWGVLPCAVIAASALVRGPAETAAHGEIEAVQTRHGASRADLGDFLRQWHIAQQAMAELGHGRAPIVVLPEGVGGLWSEPMRALWTKTETQLREENQTALIGVTHGSAVEPLSAGIVALGATRGAYRQRVPMPLAMWRPGVSSSLAPAWNGPGTLDVALGALPADASTRVVRLGVFVCWEIGVVWCVLHSVAEGAEALVVVANTAWLAGTDAARAQAQMLGAWAALFGLPAALAANT